MPPSPPDPEEQRWRAALGGLRDCTDGRLRAQLKPNERVLDLHCEDDTSIALTNTSLVVIRHHNDEPAPSSDVHNEVGAVQVSLSSYRYDLRDLHESGLVAWTHSSDTWFLLANDGTLAVLPVDDSDRSAEFYHYEQELFSMTCIGGLLFMGGPHHVVVSEFGENEASVITQEVDLEGADPEFFFDGEHLHWGVPHGPAYLLLVRGTGLGDVEILRRCLDLDACLARILGNP